MTNRTHQENTSDIYYLQQAIIELKQHAQTSNEEVGHIQVDIGEIRSDIAWLKKEFDSLSSKTWAILGTIILGILMQVVFYLSKLN